jgi:hypothetical protein
MEGPMSELSSDARNVLERGFRADAPSAERRERVKGRVLVALGGGVTALGTVSSVAGAAGPVAAAGGAKSLLGTSLFVWFATGLGAGVGVGGAAAVVQHVQAAETATRAPLPPVATAPTSEPLARPAESPPGAPPAADRALSPAVDLPSRDGHAAPPVVSAPIESGAAVPEAPPSVADFASISEEATLLQRAQRALSAGQSDAALGLLGEHELRFPSGALAEERRVAKVLALCALARTEEASILARAFVARSPRSVLIPRLETSCVGKSLVR